MPRLIQNPVLRGFHPDPSFVRVGDDYYLASSTFEWLPGVRFHHSKDLAHGRLTGHALTRPEHINLKGVENSNGVWAPSLSAPSIDGPWSNPIHMDSLGFDPSLFHDDDGRKWLLNMQWDFRKGRYRFAGIVAQEYDHARRRLVGPLHELVRKENILCEGPNLYKHNGWYYLMMAEGGTGWNHGISMARSRFVTGPYELDPQEAVLTTRHHPEHPLQKAGHGELVQTASDEWWLAHLCSRPLKTGAGLDPKSPEQSETAAAHAGQRCMLGRETALQCMVWSEDGWLRLANGGVLPDVEVAAPDDLPPHPWPALPGRDDFDVPALDPLWASLRVQAFRVTAETRIDFSPTRFSQLAGLLCWYDTKMFYYLRVSHDERLGKILDIILMDDNVYDELDDSRIEIDDWSEIYLRAEIDCAELQFSASPDGRAWQPVGPVLDASKLSDDYGQGLHFTGAFVGLAAHDVAGQRSFADFDYFAMKEN